MKNINDITNNNQNEGLENLENAENKDTNLMNEANKSEVNDSIKEKSDFYKTTNNLNDNTNDSQQQNNNMNKNTNIPHSLNEESKYYQSKRTISNNGEENKVINDNHIPYERKPINPNPQVNSLFNNSTQEYQGQSVSQMKYKAKEKKQVTRNTLVSCVIICAIISCILGIGGGFIASNVFSNKSIVYEAAKDENSVINLSETLDSGMTVTEVTQKSSESVVEIRTESVQTGNYLRQYVTEGAGSGVIITEDGYIVTNNHVVSGANKVTVTLKNGESYEGKVLGTDATADIALIQIDVKGLKPAILGDSSSINVGDIAVAIGNPLGQLGGTVTEGIISALDREITINGTDMSLLQTDASINPGNSGGGLFNSNGELIGIVVAKSSGSDVEGLGFAIPINDIKSVIKDLSDVGYVKGRPYLGVTLIDVTDAQTAMQYGVNQLGTYIASVNDNSGASKAGLQKGDLIQAIDGTVVNSSSDLKGVIQKHNVGDTVSLTIVRDNKQQTVQVTLTESSATSNLSSQ